MLVRLVAILSMLAWALVPQVAEACAPADMSIFDQLEQARYVAVGRMSGRSIRAAEVFAGGARAVRIEDQTGLACPVEVLTSHRALFILNADNGFAADRQSYVVDPTEELLALVRSYAGASAAARRAVLVQLAVSDGPNAESATLHLATHLELVARMTAAQYRLLVEAISSLPAARLESFALLLARLHLREAVAPLVARIGNTDRPERIAILLEIMTTHRIELGGHDAPFESDRWVRWRRRSSELSADFDPGAWIANYWTEWLTHIEPMEAPSASATLPALAASMRTGANAMTRIIALERCERVRGHVIAENYSRWAFGVAPQRWESFAAACEAPLAE